jgi:ribosomal protein S18 acetylase RimI-like enzyme
MAALSDRLHDTVVPIRNVPAELLAPLLEHEIADWRPLHWDFRSSAELIRRFSSMQALDGFVLFTGGVPAGFTYTVSEEGKGLVGDLYVSPAERTVDREHALLEAALRSLWGERGLRRIEAQLLMLSQALDRPVPYPAWFESFQRQFFEVPSTAVPRLPQKEIPSMILAPWHDQHHSQAARVITASYAGHIDARINDQYRSVPGARKFLTNIVQYPGCGAFYPGASFVATDRATQAMCGLCLASMVSEDGGHITQVCVTPRQRGTGLGYELIRRSLVALAARGAKSVSLTVTSANREAIALYERMGFRSSRDFAAYVWEKP